MKTIITLLFLIFSALLLPAQTNNVVTNGCVTLIWDLSLGDTGDTNTEGYVLHHSTNALLAPMEWEVIATIAGTNQGQMFFPVGVHFFFLTFFNAWGESPPSNIIGTPQAPMAPGNLRILRLSQTP